MLYGTESIPPYERQLLQIFEMAAQNSPDLTGNQKDKIEARLQEIVYIWKGEDRPTV